MHFLISATYSGTGARVNDECFYLFKFAQKINMSEYRNHPLYKAYTIDTMMNSVWEFYKKNFLVLFIVSLLFALTAQYFSSLMMIDLSSIQSETDPMALLEKLKEFMAPMAILSLINLLFSVIIQHYIIVNPVDTENNILKSFVRSLKYYIPFLILIILLSFAGAIAIVLGLFMLVVGAFFAAIYIAAIYLFILPVMIVEGTDIGRTINRVFTLLHRRFWTNFGWVSVFIAMLLVISMVLSGLILLPFSADFLKTIINPENASDVSDVTKSPLYFILTSLVNALTLPLMPVFSAILYFNAKAAEDKKQQDYLPGNDEGRVKVEDLYAKPYSDGHPDNPENKKDGVN